MMTATPEAEDPANGLQLRLMTLESRAKALFIHHPEPIYELDPEGRFRHANLGGVAFAGLRETEGQGMHFSRFITAADRDLVEQHFQEALAGRHTDCRARVRNLTGVEDEVQMHMLPISSQHGTLGVYVLVRREPTAADLAASREVRRLFEAIPVSAALLAVAGEDYPVVLANPALGSLLGLTPDDLVGRPLPTLGEPDSPAARRLQVALADRQPACEPLHVTRHDGQILNITLHLRPIAPASGEDPVEYMLALPMPASPARDSERVR